jgi:hypothetical protein
VKKTKQSKKRASSQSGGVRTGKISNVGRDVRMAGRDMVTHETTGLQADEIKELFEPVYRSIDSRADMSKGNKEDLKTDVKEIQTAVTEAKQQNQKVEESFLLRRFRNIARMAPDLLDVVVATLVNPLAGLGVAVKKLAEKAKQDTS